jgi:class 3 adenylate cyclase/tetratricopeptide (TPR) repeat protein
MTNDIDAWLNHLGLGCYVALFSENDIAMDVLPELVDADLKELGISLGHRKRLLKAIRELNTGGDVADSGTTSTEAERRQLTVMFCDLVGSTKLSVRLDPEELREVISLFQKRCAEVAQSFGGNVARYMGDGLLIYFGYPRADEHDPESAIHAGLATIKAVGKLDPGGDIVLQTRVGISTGEVVVGDLIGAGSAREQSVVGETPNLAARLQSLAEPDQVVIGHVTRKLVQGLFEFQDLGQHLLKGFDSPVNAWRVARESAFQSRFEAIHPVEELTPLVSREHEADRLLKRWSEVLAGTGQAVLVSGEAGIGKSRLIHMLREELAPVPHNLLRYYCAPHFQNTALFPMIRQLESVARFEPGASNVEKLEKLEELIEQGNNEPAELAPFLAAMISIPTEDRYPPLNLSPQRFLERTLQSLELQLSGLAKNRPVLAIFEDLHWIDPTTLELLNRAVARIQDMPVMLLMTARSEFQSPWRDNQSVMSLQLDRLDHDDSATLAAQVASGKHLPDEVIDLIVQKTDGVPLFIEELAKMIVESDFLDERDEAINLSARLPDLALPNTLQDLLMARLDRLANAKDLAQIGAAIGRQFSHKLLLAVSEQTPSKVNEGVIKLMSADIVSAKGHLPDSIYTFKHALIQDSAYSGLLKGKRKKLHLNIAAALQTQSPDISDVRPETLAYHFKCGEEYETAIAYGHRAANIATDRAAHTDAIEHVSDALELLSALPDGSQKIKTEIGLRVTLGRNQEALLGYASKEIEQTFARAHDLCKMADEKTELVPVLLGLCVFHLVRGYCAVARELAEQCVRLSEEAGDIDYQIESNAILTFAQCYLGELEASHQTTEACLSLYKSRHGGIFVPVTAQNPGVSVLGTDALVLWQLGYADQSLRCIEESLTMAEELEQPINLALVYTHAAELYQLRGESAKALEQANLVIKIASEHGYIHWQLLGTLHLGIAMGILGETLEALAMTGETLNLLSASGAGMNLTYFLGGVSQIHLAEGHPEKGLLVLDRALRQSEETQESMHNALLHILRGECHLNLASPDTEAAASDFLQAIEVARKQKAKMLELRANCRLYRMLSLKGENAEAKERLAASLSVISEGFDTVDVVEARELLGASV